MNLPYNKDLRFRLPENIYRVTAGNGGESFLIDGGDKIAIYDCGMAYCAEGLIANMEGILSEIGKDKPDMILVSHSHYDHIGALPYLLEKWPDIKVIGAAKLQKVFTSDGARQTMERLGESARDKYLGRDHDNVAIKTSPLRVDRILDEGEEIDLGRYKVRAYYTPGHTDCSMVFLLENKEPNDENRKETILFLSESIGVLEDNNVLHTSILKSYEDTILSAEKCKSLNADVLIGAHYGVIPDTIRDRYFDMYIEFAEKEKNFIMDMYKSGLGFEEMLDGYEKEYWTNNRVSAQPRDAFIENARHTISLIIETFGG